MKVINKLKDWRLKKKIAEGKMPKGRIGSQLQNLDEGKKKPGTVTLIGKLYAKKVSSNGDVVDYGLVSDRLVTQAFVQYLVDSMQNSAAYPMDVFVYHGCGTDGTAEANTQTALIAEIGTRQVGTKGEGSSANIYQTVATISFDASYVIREHGVFNAATAGVLLDRSVIAGGIAIDSGDAIQFTYELIVVPES